MNAQTLKGLIDEKKDILLIDVREKDEYAQADKIEDSTNIPMGQMFLEASKGNLPKDTKIVTVCKSGVRCEIIARELKQRGYDIDHLEGGIDAWRMAVGLN